MKSEGWRIASLRAIHGSRAQPWSRHFWEDGFRVVQIKIFTMAFSPRLGGFDDEPLRDFIADKQVHSPSDRRLTNAGKMPALPVPLAPLCLRAFVC